MAAKKKKAKKARKPAKRKGAKKTAKRKVAKKKSASRRPSARRKKLAKALAPTVDRMKSSATEMGHGAIDAGRLLFEEAKETGKDAGEKMKEMTTDWINRVT